MGIHRGHKARPVEWIAEKLIFAVSLTAILMVFLIFLFIGREALPIFLGTMNSAAAQEVIPVDQMETMKPERLRAYLGLSQKEFKEMDPATRRAIMEVRVEAAKEAGADRDASINTVAWRYLLRPFQWSDYDHPVYIWQPVSTIHKYNIIPLIAGSLKTTLVALLFSVPVALGAAVYVSQLASPRLKELIKPAIELLSAIPSVVLGSFAMLVLATILQSLFGYQYRLNAFLAGLALGLAAIPVVFSIAEDALTSVPAGYTQAALALGASKWRAAWEIVLPAAVPGVFAAVILGFGRCIGETMVVLIASGNASILSWSLLDPCRTVTATIAAELGETVVGGAHYRMLFMLGTLLFVVTFLTNLTGELVIGRLKARLEGGK
jgi:phosphate transport system permease protein